MIHEVRKLSMAWMEMDYYKDTPFQWKIKWHPEHLRMLEVMGEAAPLTRQ